MVSHISSPITWISVLTGFAEENSRIYRDFQVGFRSKAG